MLRLNGTYLQQRIPHIYRICFDIPQEFQTKIMLQDITASVFECSLLDIMRRQIHSLLDSRFLFTVENRATTNEKSYVSPKKTVIAWAELAIPSFRTYFM